MIHTEIISFPLEYHQLKYAILNVFNVLEDLTGIEESNSTVLDQKMTRDFQQNSILGFGIYNIR